MSGIGPPEQKRHHDVKQGGADVGGDPGRRRAGLVAGHAPDGGGDVHPLQDLHSPAGRVIESSGLPVRKAYARVKYVRQER